MIPQVRRQSAVIRRYHSHSGGLMYVGFTLLLAIGAVNSQNNLLFIALGLAIGGLLVSGILSGASLLGIRVERQVPGRATLGQPLPIRYRITNANRFMAAFGLHIVESPSRPAVSSRQAGWRIPKFSLSPAPHTFVVHLPPGGVSEREVLAIPRARGRTRFDTVQVWSTFPFGLARKSVNFAIPRTVLVLPPDLPLRSGLIASFTARSRMGAGGETSPGHGDEFFGLREYVAGDNPKRIAWKRSARTGQVVVRQNAAPSPTRLWIVVNLMPALELPDASEPANGALSQAALSERAICLAAAVIRGAAASGMAVGLSVPLDRIVHPPREGRAHIERLLTDLALLDRVTSRTAQVSSLGAPATRGSACVVIHASHVQPEFGPPAAHHILASRAEDYLAGDDAAVVSMLAVLDATDGRFAGARRLDRARAALRRLLPTTGRGGAL